MMKCSGHNYRVGANRLSVKGQEMSETENGTSINQLVDRYFTMWNETDPVRRGDVIAATWSRDARYVDPLLAAEGYEGLDKMVAGVHQQYPGYRFRLMGPIDMHHDRVRWSWELAAPDSSDPVAAGIDVATLASDGRLGEVVGFFEQPSHAS